MQFVETLIIYPGLASPEACVPPEGTPSVFLASVDPLTMAADPPGEIPSDRPDKLYVSFRHAKPLTSTPQTFTFAFTSSDSSGRIEPLMRTMLFKVASFKAEVPGAGSVVLCLPPENWLFVDYVDPIETLVYQGNTLGGEGVGRVNRVQVLVA
jgi:hypothetical protein